MVYCSLFDAELYKGSYWPVVNFHYARTWSEYRMEFHHHVDTEIMYLFWGHCMVTIKASSSSETEYDMHSGDFILLDSDVRHKLTVSGERACYILNIQFSFEDTNNTMHTMKNILINSHYIHSLTSTRQPIITGRDPSGELYRAFSVMLNSFQRVRLDPSSRLLFDAEFTVFIEQLARCVYDNRLRLRQPPHVRKALRYIESRYCEHISVSMIAAHVGVNSTYLQRIFKSSVGETLTGYIQRLRIDKAMALLEYVDILSIDEIAHFVGFAKRQRFTATFKKLTHMSPSDYRRSINRADRFQFGAIDDWTPEDEPLAGCRYD